MDIFTLSPKNININVVCLTTLTISFYLNCKNIAIKNYIFRNSSDSNVSESIYFKNTRNYLMFMTLVFLGLTNFEL